MQILFAALWAVIKTGLFDKITTTVNRVFTPTQQKPTSSLNIGPNNSGHIYVGCTFTVNPPVALPTTEPIHSRKIDPSLRPRPVGAAAMEQIEQK